jgi:hypothetical protein
MVVRGFPIDSWSEDEAGIAFWCIGKHLGRAGAQNGKGDILGHVKNEFSTEAQVASAHGKVRQYRTSEAITFHCDAADVVALFCLGQGISGGSSRVVIYIFKKRGYGVCSLSSFEPCVIVLRNLCHPSFPIQHNIYTYIQR